MLEIEVLRPTKTESLYEFRCDLRPRRTLRDRLRRDGPERARLEPSELQFGYRARNFTIRHHELWDGFYPLFFLTRNGGPLYNKGFDRAHIRFEYAISPVVRDFFIARAASFGFAVTVEADTADLRFDGTASGDVLAFGGGKDSRLLLGLLREFGIEPTVITAKGAYATDLPDALVTESLHGALADRIMPSFMAMGRHFYFGATIGDIHVRTPWQQHYDLASPGPLDEMSKLLGELGSDTQIIAPLTPLPYNIIQRMLHDRYPELYGGQVSTRPGSRAEKSLHIALLKLTNGYSFEDQCSEPDFVMMLERFVRKQTNHPDDFDYRDARITVNHEMRAIIWRNRENELFSGASAESVGDLRR